MGKGYGPGREPGFGGGLLESSSLSQRPVVWRALSEVIWVILGSIPNLKEKDTCIASVVGRTFCQNSPFAPPVGLIRPGTGFN